MNQFETRNEWTYFSITVHINYYLQLVEEILAETDKDASPPENIYILKSFHLPLYLYCIGR